MAQRLVFLPMQRVTLMMPASEAMLASKRTGTEVVCIVRYHWLQDRTCQPVVYWEDARGNEYASGYTLGECGIIETGTRPYTTLHGDVRDENDPEPEDIQARAWELASELSQVLEAAGAVEIRW